MRAWGLRLRRVQQPLAVARPPAPAAASTLLPGPCGVLSRSNYQIELGRLQDRQIGRLGAFEDSACIYARLAMHVWKIDSVTHQAASDGIDVVRKAGGRSVGEVPDHGRPLPLRVRHERPHDEPTCNTANERSPSITEAPRRRQVVQSWYANSGN